MTSKKSRLIGSSSTIRILPFNATVNSVSDCPTVVHPCQRAASEVPSRPHQSQNLDIVQANQSPGPRIQTWCPNPAVPRRAGGTSGRTHRQPRQDLSPSRNRRRRPVVGRAHERTTRLDRAEHGQRQVLPARSRSRSPGVIGQVDQDLGPVLGEGPSPVGKGILKTDGSSHDDPTDGKDVVLCPRFPKVRIGLQKPMTDTPRAKISCTGKDFGKRNEAVLLVAALPAAVPR